MTRSKAVGSAQGLNEGSKHWANFVHRQMGGDKERHAVKAETLFFTWLWKRERKGGVMTDPVRVAGELNEKSRHRANYMYYQPGSIQKPHAWLAETLFFYWLWRKG